MALENTRNNSDESDVGNEIGVVIGRLPKDGKAHSSLDCGRASSQDEVKSFIFWLKHGISLSNGTH